jgi:hypothetical protein
MASLVLKNLKFLYKWQIRLKEEISLDTARGMVAYRTSVSSMAAVFVGGEP